MEQEYFTPRQVAQRLRVDYTTVIRWIKTGLLDVETIQEGRRNRHRIKQSVIEAIEHRDPKHQRVLV
jgi:predicted site-specific integrase-resolvase